MARATPVKPLLLLSLIALTVLGSAAALADSYWDHNGSLMRLVAKGSERLFYYEKPKDSLRQSGVRPGTLLFNGTTQNERYEGVARRFSKHCPESPLEYWVTGNVVRPQGQLQVVLTGPRPVHQRCQETGKIVEDRLVFTYRYKD
jgi:hypothetical protein